MDTATNSDSGIRPVWRFLHLFLSDLLTFCPGPEASLALIRQGLCSSWLHCGVFPAGRRRQPDLAGLTASLSFAGFSLLLFLTAALTCSSSSLWYYSNGGRLVHSMVAHTSTFMLHSCHELLFQKAVDSLDQTHPVFWCPIYNHTHTHKIWVPDWLFRLLHRLDSIHVK